MLFFVDETWQKIGDQDVGALAAVAVPRSRSEDINAACAIQSFLVRVGQDWTRRFMQTPHFTVSAVSPGLQAADLIAYLAAHRHDPTVRPELVPYWERVERIAFRGQRPSLRLVNAIPDKEKGPAEARPPKRR